MAYCTKQQMIDRFKEAELIQLTDIDSVGVINDSVLDQAIDDAMHEINSYLSKYTLPLSVVPAVLVRKSCDITRYFLYDDAATDEVSKRYDSAIKFLLNVSKGLISLGADAAGDKPSSTSTATFKSDPKTFSRSDSGFL